jgi:hypothetical protein
VRSDIYSLGVVMYEALAGRLPFQADNAADLIVSVLNAVPIPLVSLRPDLGQELSDLIGKAMARLPEDRFQNTEEMRLALVSFLEQGSGVENLALPRRYIAPKSGPCPENGEPSSQDPFELSETLGMAGGDSLRPTAALLPLVVPMRKRMVALGFGVLGLLLAITTLALVTTGGQPNTSARAEGKPTPVVALTEEQSRALKEVLVDLQGLPQDATVRVDGRNVIGNPLRLVRGSGGHQITIEAPGMQLWSVIHDAYEDGHYAISLEPEAKPEKVRGTRSKSAKSKSGLLRRPDF